MKRIYLILALLISVVTNTYAAGITSIDEFENTKVYFVTCAQKSTRGTWYFNTAHPDTLWGSAVAGATADNTDPNCQYAFLKSTRRGLLYFYSVGGKKFIHATGDSYVYLTDDPVSSQNQLVKSSKTSYPWVAQDNGFHFNLSSNQYCGLLSSWWSLSDKGNTIKIEEVADVTFDPTDALARIDAFEQSFSIVNITYNEMFGDKVLSTYTQQKFVTNGETMTFDAPQTFFGLKATSDTHEPVVINEDQDITVNYNFVTNAGALPFETIPADATAFPDDTPWYYMTVGGSSNYAIYNPEAGTFSAAENEECAIDRPIDANAMFCFAGDPINGYHIYNRGTGDISQSVSAQATDGTTIGMGNDNMCFKLENNVTDGYEFSLVSNGNFYMRRNDENNVVSFNNYDTGCNDSKTTITFTRVPAADIEKMENNLTTLHLDSISPAEGLYVGALDSIRIHYWNYISIKQDGEDNLIRVYNTKTGDLVDSVYGKVDPDDEATLLIDFTNALMGGSTYEVVIPDNTIYGDDGEIAQSHTFTYTVKGALKPGIVTARVWGTRLGDRINDTPIQEMLGTYSDDNDDYPIAKHLPWDMIDYTSKGYFNTKVDVKSENEIVICDFTGLVGDTLDIVYTNSTDWGDFQKVNGGVRTSYDGYIYWDIKSDITPESSENMGYIRVMADTSLGGSMAHCWPDLGYGFACISLYDYEELGYYTIYVDYYLDDRYNSEEPTASFAETEVSMKQRDVITNELTTNSPGAVTYYSSNEAVATVDETGKVTATGVGTAVITAEIAASGKYTAKKVSYTVNVLENAELNAQLRELIATAKEMYTDEELATVQAHASTSIEKALLNLGDAVATASAITNAFQEDIDALTAAIDGYKGSVPDGTSYTIRGVIPSYVVNQINADTKVYTIRLTGATRIFGNFILRDGCELTTGEDGVEATTLSYAVSDDSEWGTICMPFELKSDDNIQYYELGGTQTSGTNVMYFDPVSSVAAHQPALYHRTGTGITLTSEEGVTLNTTAPGTMVSVDNLKFTGTYKEQTITSGYYYSDGSFLNAAGSSATILPYHAFFALQDASAGPATGSFTIAINTPTGIRTITTDLSGKTIYSAAGVKLSKPARGINIIDGRKVMVK